MRSHLLSARSASELCGAPRLGETQPHRTRPRKDADAQLIESTIVSLDGIAEAPDRWARFDQEAGQDSMNELENYDAFVMGSVTYERLRPIWNTSISPTASSRSSYFEVSPPPPANPTTVIDSVPTTSRPCEHR